MALKFPSKAVAEDFIAGTVLRVFTLEVCEHMFNCGITPQEEVAPDVAGMVDRFLSWPLPENFSPDHCISFDREDAERLRAKTNGVMWPTGTNLFTAPQAKKMVEHMLAKESAAPQFSTAGMTTGPSQEGVGQGEVAPAADPARAALKMAAEV